MDGPLKEKKEKNDEEWNFSQAAAYCNLLTNQHDLHPHICEIIQLMLVQPPSVADNERGFSQMSLIKTAKRSRMLDVKLNALLMINRNHKFIKMHEVVQSWITQQRMRKAQRIKRKINNKT